MSSMKTTITLGLVAEDPRLEKRRNPSPERRFERPDLNTRFADFG